MTSVGLTPRRSATRWTTSPIGTSRLRQSAISGVADELLHVDAGTGIEHRAALGERDHGQRAGAALGAEARPLERVDGDVDPRRAAVADLLAVEEHRRLVLLALADHDDAVHRDRVDQQPHRVDGGAVGRLLVAAADPARGGQRGGLGHADELEREVAVGLGARAHVRGRSRPSAEADRGPTQTVPGALRTRALLGLHRTADPGGGDAGRGEQGDVVADLLA